MLIIFIGVVVLLFATEYFNRHMNFAYACPRMLDRKEKTMLSHISFFRTNESYATQKDVKRRNGGEEQLNNAARQEELNKSKRVRRIRKMQKQQERKRRIRNYISLFHARDYLMIFIYMGLPLICIALLHFAPIYKLFKDVIVGVSYHRVDIYLSQLSLTFITISLMSIFSDSNAIILWENIVKKTLIDPPASCFKAYFIYSFVYLFFSTVSIALRNDIEIGVLFVFNILCLFDLSRIMIDCYYDPEKKKRKVVKDFINKIEEANIAALHRGPGNESREVISEVQSTFEDFNYYIKEAYEKGKYSDVSEYLAVYGKLLARLDSATIAADEIRVLDWYSPKTYKAYKELVKYFYKEGCNLVVLGFENTNAQSVSSSSLSIERNIFDKALVRLVNDTPNGHEVSDIYNLALYAFYVNLLFVARNVDMENFETYFIETENAHKDIILNYKKEELKEAINRLMIVLYEESENESIDFYMIKARFEFVLGKLLGNIIMINTEDIMILELDFLCWDGLEDKEAIKRRIKEYINVHVSESIEACSDERKQKCLSRKDKVLQKL